MIECKDVSFRYEESTHGVSHIDLPVSDGECVVLIGASGCGKTTLTRLMNGLAPKYYTGTKTGQIWMDGEEISAMPMWAVGRMVGSIFQDPRRQFFSSELVGEVAFACENYGFSQMEIRQRTDEAIRKMDLEHLSETPLHLLSGGEKQRTAIASVYALHPRIFVFDEPTANLDREGIDQMKNTLLELKKAGHTLVVAEHRISWLREIADRYVYMEQGSIQRQYLPSEIDRMPMSERMAKGIRVSSEVPIQELPFPNLEVPAILEGEDLSYQRGKKLWEKKCFRIPAQKITAVTGQNGIGKTTLALILSGLADLKGGHIKINGKTAKESQRRKQVYYCANDTGAQFFTDSVSSEVLLNMERTDKNLEKVRSMLKYMSLYEYKDAHPATLSGGQKQRLAVCCALVSDKDIIVLDEPTSGLDGRNMRLIAEILKDATKKGKTVLVITHDEELVSACCDYRIDLSDSLDSSSRSKRKLSIC